jgi:hypothetical protein
MAKEENTFVIVPQTQWAKLFQNSHREDNRLQSLTASDQTFVCLKIFLDEKSELANVGKCRREYF